jgi:hypothetical protein
MGGLQVPVGFVLGVPVAIVGEGIAPPGRVRYRAVFAQHRSTRRRPLVDVVADVHHEVQSLTSHVSIGCVVATLPMLTRSKGKPHAGGRGVSGRRSLGTPGGAGVGSVLEAVIVARSGRELDTCTFDASVNVYRVGELRVGSGRAATDDRGEVCVRSDLPAN